MATATQLMTADELMRLPDDGMRHELVRGELQSMSPASARHGKIALKLGRSLGNYVEEHHLGETYGAETGFILESDPDTVRAPDVAFVRSERVASFDNERGYGPEAPDLAIEVISPNDSFSDVESKALDYLQAGTGMVIVVNPRNRTVTIYRAFADIAILTENDTIDGEDIVPGWTCQVRSIFE